MNAINPSAINPSTLSFTIKLESEDYAPEDSEWQEECHKFYLQLKNALDIGVVKPLKIEKKEKGYRCFGPNEVFTIIGGLAVASEIALIFLAARDWLAHKNGAKITLDFGGRNYMEYIPLIRPLLSKELECYKCHDKDKCILECPQLMSKGFVCKMR